MSAPRSTTPASPGRPPAHWRSSARRDQAFAVAIGAALLGCAVLMQSMLSNERKPLVREDPESEKTLGSLAVTFPRLTLGGLRGAVSTVLWMQAEEDKNNRRWDELETKYDLIGALQPYFASVYIYHSWNQAYNLSAQWQEQDIKYKWVLDGLVYLYKGENFNPGNPDILFEEGQLYAQKLGSSFERIYYRAHWRHDLSRLHELNDLKEAQTDDTVALRNVRKCVTRVDPRDPPGSPSYFHTEELRDPNGSKATGWGIRIFPDTDAKSGFNLFKDRTDGGKPDDPLEFRYGVSPYYFAYIEYKRCLALPIGPTYMSLRIVNSWMPMSLRLWCRDDLYYTGETMRQLFGPKPDAALLNDKDAFNAKVAEIHDCYRNIQMIAPRAVDLFNAHLDPKKYPEDMNVHPKHILETQADKEIAKAEIKLFDALVKWHLNGQKLDERNEIKTAFLEADALYQQAYPVTMKWVDFMYPPGSVNNDRADFECYANALLERSRGIKALLTLPPGQKPDLTFLMDDVVQK